MHRNRFLFLGKVSI